MRKNLVFSTMLVVLIAVVSIAVPVSFLMRRTIHAEVHYRLELQAEALAQHFTEEVLKGEPIEKGSAERHTTESPFWTSS